MGRPCGVSRMSVERTTQNLLFPGEIEVPEQLIDQLIQIALRTEPGASLVSGFRMAHPVIPPEKGSALLSVRGYGVIKLGSPEK